MTHGHISICQLMRRGYYRELTIIHIQHTQVDRWTVLQYLIESVLQYLTESVLAVSTVHYEEGPPLCLTIPYTAWNSYH